MTQVEFEHILATAYEVGTGIVIVLTGLSHAFPKVAFFQRAASAIGKCVADFSMFAKEPK